MICISICNVKYSTIIFIDKFNVPFLLMNMYQGMSYSTGLSSNLAIGKTVVAQESDVGKPGRKVSWEWVLAKFPIASFP